MLWVLSNKQLFIWCNYTFTKYIFNFLFKEKNYKINLQILSQR